ncbi:hypothetical protein PCIT_a2977 [Pseudoalteromonas citrea]|uniref:Uncharacterized protein n=2 Tax=Pseudoalteromonas citrea TaxID=43655 RepID=A0AAD4AI20_9GAMM|nr:hypothetical protein [Pseudoalteromonas citrea]KAF7770031.1 hypothetical protein PCIT_a2977 [Pseudoalteromonas citrea]
MDNTSPRSAVAYATSQTLMTIAFTLINTGKCFASTSEIVIDSMAVPATNNPLTQNKPLYNRAQYFAPTEQSVTAQHSETVWIKFLDVRVPTGQSEVNITTFAGGHALNTWIKVNQCAVSGGERIALINPNNNTTQWFSTGNAQHIEAQIIMTTAFESDEFDVMPYVDIIGHIDDIVATFPKGVMGQINANYVPDGSGQRFNLTQKARDKGPEFCAYKHREQWHTATSAMALDTAQSSISNADILQPNSVALYFYDAIT